MIGFILVTGFIVSIAQSAYGITYHKDSYQLLGLTFMCLIYFCRQISFCKMVMFNDYASGKGRSRWHLAKIVFKRVYWVKEEGLDLLEGYYRAGETGGLKRKWIPGSVVVNRSGLKPTHGCIMTRTRTASFNSTVSLMNLRIQKLEEGPCEGPCVSKYTNKANVIQLL